MFRNETITKAEIENFIVKIEQEKGNDHPTLHLIYMKFRGILLEWDKFVNPRENWKSWALHMRQGIVLLIWEYDNTPSKWGLRQEMESVIPALLTHWEEITSGSV